MRYFRHETEAKKVTLYPFVCWHIGSPHSDQKFIDEMIYRVKHDDTARWIYMGDGGEVVTKSSKGDVFEQTMSPQEQLNELNRLMQPIKSKGLFGIKGNHGHRTYKDTGLEFDESLMLALGLPYLGTAALWHLKVNKSLYSIYTHHGADSGVSISSKINAAKKPELFVAADAVITAHSHIAMELPPRYMMQLNAGVGRHDPIKWTTTHNYIVGSAYDSRGGYAEDKMYPPIIPSHFAITFEGGRDNEGNPVKRQSVQVYRAAA